MFEHLKLFLGSRKKLLDHYMIRFKNDSEVEYLTTNGQILCVNWFKASHGAAGKIVAITPDDFNRLIALEGELVFTLVDTDLMVFAGNQSITLNTLNPSCIPNIDRIVEIPPLTGVRPWFRPSHLTTIAEYCKAVGSDEIRFGFAGDRLPMKICDVSKGWVIYMMPIGNKK